MAENISGGGMERLWNQSPTTVVVHNNAERLAVAVDSLVYPNRRIDESLGHMEVPLVMAEENPHRRKVPRVVLNDEEVLEDAVDRERRRRRRRSSSGRHRVEEVEDAWFVEEKPQLSERDIRRLERREREGARLSNVWRSGYEYKVPPRRMSKTWAVNADALARYELAMAGSPVAMEMTEGSRKRSSDRIVHDRIRYSKDKFVSRRSAPRRRSSRHEFDRHSLSRVSLPRFNDIEQNGVLSRNEWFSDEVPQYRRSRKRDERINLLKKPVEKKEWFQDEFYKDGWNRVKENVINKRVQKQGVVKHEEVVKEWFTDDPPIAKKTVEKVAFVDEGIAAAPKKVVVDTDVDVDVEKEKVVGVKECNKELAQKRWLMLREKMLSDIDIGSKWKSVLDGIGKEKVIAQDEVVESIGEISEYIRDRGAEEGLGEWRSTKEFTPPSCTTTRKSTLTTEQMTTLCPPSRLPETPSTIPVSVPSHRTSAMTRPPPTPPPTPSEDEIMKEIIHRPKTHQLPRRYTCQGVRHTLSAPLFEGNACLNECGTVSEKMCKACQSYFCDPCFHVAHQSLASKPEYIIDNKKITMLDDNFFKSLEYPGRNYHCVGDESNCTLFDDRYPGRQYWPDDHSIMTAMGIPLSSGLHKHGFFNYLYDKYISAAWDFESKRDRLKFGETMVETVIDSLTRKSTAEDERIIENLTRCFVYRLVFQKYLNERVSLRSTHHKLWHTVERQLRVVEKEATHDATEIFDNINNMIHVFTDLPIEEIFHMISFFRQFV